MEKLAFYSIPTCVDRIIAVDNDTILVHIHGKWRADKAIMLSPTGVASFVVAADAMGMQVVPATMMRPPLLIMSEGLN